MKKINLFLCLIILSSCSTNITNSNSSSFEENNEDPYVTSLEVISKAKKNNYIVLLKTESDIDEVDEQFVLLLNLMGVDINVIKESSIKTKIKDNSKNNKKITNMIIALMIITTVIILCMMFILELR